jgi:uncharacterized protein (DUF433 family)
VAPVISFLITHLYGKPTAKNGSMIGCFSYINFGMPSLSGRRLTVFDIVTKLLYEDSLATTIEDYEILPADVLDALSYCTSLACQNDPGRINYCDGCLLRTFDEGHNSSPENFTEFRTGQGGVTRSNDGLTLFLGSYQEFKNSQFGKVTWMIAGDLMQKYF